MDEWMVIWKTYAKWKNWKTLRLRFLIVLNNIPLHSHFTLISLCILYNPIYSFLARKTFANRKSTVQAQYLEMHYVVLQIVMLVIDDVLYSMMLSSQSFLHNFLHLMPLLCLLLRCWTVFLAVYRLNWLEQQVPLLKRMCSSHENGKECKQCS